MRCGGEGDCGEIYAKASLSLLYCHFLELFKFYVNCIDYGYYGYHELTWHGTFFLTFALARSSVIVLGLLEILLYDGSFCFLNIYMEN